MVLPYGSMTIEQVIKRLCSDDVMEWIIENKDVRVHEDSRDSNWAPLFFVACRTNKFDIARELIRLGIDVNVYDMYGSSVIHHYYYMHQVVDFLLSFPNFDVNQTEYYTGSTPLHLARFMIHDSKKPYVLKLLKAGARTDIKNNAGYLPFFNDETLQQLARKVKVLLVLCRMKGLPIELIRSLNNYL